MTVSRRYIFVLVAVGLLVFSSAHGTFKAPESGWERAVVPTENVAYTLQGFGLDVRDGLKAVAMRTLDRSDPRFEGKALYVTTGQEDGSWSEPVEIADSDHDIRFPPLVRIDSRNHIHVVWPERERDEDDPMDTEHWIRYATYDGQAWTEPITLFHRWTPFLPPTTLVIDADDRLYFAVSAFAEDGGAARNYLVSSRDDDWTITEVADGTPDPGPPSGGIEASLALSTSGTFHLVFTAGSGDSDNDIYHTYSLDEGETWAPARRLHRSGARFAHSPTLRAGPGDALHLAWREAPARGALSDEAYHAYLSEDRLLSEAARAADGEDALRCQTSHLTADVPAQFVDAPALSVAPSGQASILLMTLHDLSDGDGAIYHAYWDAQWEDLVLLEDAPGGNATATAYHNGKVYAVYSRVVSPESEKRIVELAHQPVPFDRPVEPPVCRAPTGNAEAASVTPYPNPTAGTLSVDVCPPEDAAFVDLRLYNALGQRVRTFLRQPVPDAASCITVSDLDVGSLASGVYYLEAAANRTAFDTTPVVITR